MKVQVVKQPELDTNTAHEYALLIRGEILALGSRLYAQLLTDLENIRNGDAPEMDTDTLAECVAMSVRPNFGMVTR
jgi:hypothetical protein